MWRADVPTATGVENRLRTSLESGRFIIVVEVVAPSQEQPLKAALAPALGLARALRGDRRVTTLSVTDRLRSDGDHDAARVAAALAPEGGTMPLVHLAGKGRTLEDLAHCLGRLEAAGLDNVLCVTGDRLKSAAAGRGVPYVDSVDAVRLTRQLRPSALIAAGVAPFKYTEESTFGQYFKMGKKHAAGADCLITQVGWDMRKLAELFEYRRQVGLGQPVLVSCMALSAAMARTLHAGKVPGIVVTDDLLLLAEHEVAAPDRGRVARIERLALQIVGTERLGCAGVQLSGILKADDVPRVLDRVDAWRERLPTAEAWRLEWDERLRLPSGQMARTAPDRAFWVFDRSSPQASPARAGERSRHRALEVIHRAVFTPGSPVRRVLEPLARASHERRGSLVGWRLLNGASRDRSSAVGSAATVVSRRPRTSARSCVPRGWPTGPAAAAPATPVRRVIRSAFTRACIASPRRRVISISLSGRWCRRRLVAPAPRPGSSSSPGGRRRPSGSCLHRRSRSRDRRTAGRREDDDDPQGADAARGAGAMG